MVLSEKKAVFMKFTPKRIVVLLAIVVLGAGFAAGCVPVPSAAPGAGQPLAAIPQPTAGLTETVAPTATALPTLTPTSSPAPTHTATPSPSPRATSTVAATRTPAPTPTATVDRHLIVITEDEISKAVASGAGAQQGVNVQNLKVRFADGKIHITADRLGYGLIQVQNLSLVGRLVANNGVLSLQTESISPGGLVANMIPGMVNQALAQYGSQWYVEDVQVLDGQVRLRIR